MTFSRLAGRVFSRAHAARALPRRARLCTALATALPLMALAQTDATAPPIQTAAPSPSAASATLEPTVVTATRVEQPLSELVADVSVVDRDTIEKSGATGVADLLERLPGVQMTRNGGPGTSTSLFIRGAETRFTAVYIDGVRVDSQSTGGAPWESIPLAQIDRIEVLRGPAAAVYGSDAIAGVVQLFTKKGEGGATPFVSWGLGSRGTQNLQLGVSGTVGAFDYSVGASHEFSRGFDARTPNVRHNPDADGYRNSAGNLRLGWQINDRQRLEFTGLQSLMNSGYDGFSYNPARPVDERNVYRLRAAGLSWIAQWTPSYQTRLSLTDSYQDYQTQVKNQPPDYITRTRLRGYLFQNEYRQGAHRFTAALERKEDSLDNPALDAFSTTIDRRRSQDGLALGYGYHQGAHTLQVNVRRDQNSQFGGKTTGSVAYGYEFVPNWRLSASLGSAFRVPTLYQLYSQYGDASLRPETSRNAEIALRYAKDGSSASLTVYNNRVRNLIDFDFDSTACGSFSGCYANVGRAVYRGVTLAASQRVGDALTLRGSVDFQDPRDLDTGHLLARRARHYATLGADWRVGGWTLGAELQAVGRRWADAGNTQALGGYGVVNLSATGQLSRDLSLVARVDNLGDKRYQRVKDYATAGRSFYVGLKWQPQ